VSGRNCGVIGASGSARYGPPPRGAAAEDVFRLSGCGCDGRESVVGAGSAVSVGVGVGFGFGNLGILNCAEAICATKNTVMTTMRITRNERLIFASSINFLEDIPFLGIWNQLLGNSRIACFEKSVGLWVRLRIFLSPFLGNSAGG